MSKTRSEIAMDKFTEGYNCAQSVALAFADLTDMDEAMLASCASSFGGGIGRLREVCGCVSGMAMILGLLCGYDDPKAVEEKAKHYERVQTVARRFEEMNGSIVCRELLGLSAGHDEPTPEARTEAYYKKRPCKELVGMAATILDEYLIKEGITGK